MPIAEHAFVQLDHAVREGRLEETRDRIPTLTAEYNDSPAPSLEPNSVASYRLRSEVSRLAGDFQGAARDIAAAIRLAPHETELLSEYAHAAVRAQIFDEAAEILAAAALRDPLNAFSQNLAGAMLQLADRAEEALPYHVRAVEYDPHQADYLNNLGTTYRRLARFDEAETFLARAITVDTKHFMAWYNIGNIYRSTRRLQLAERAYRRSIAIYPYFPESHFTLALTLLQQDRWEDGWHEFEWRWQSPKIVTPIDINIPLWDGRQPAGKRLIVVTEQGSGDTLQFVRYTEELVARGAQVTIWAPKETAPLLRRLPHLHAVETYRTEIPDADAFIPMMSLPRVLGSTPAEIPQAPYLLFGRDRAAAFAEELGPRRERLRLGLAWAGNPKQGDDHLRSAKLTDFAALFDVPGIRWISVQKGPPSEEIQASGFAIEDWSECLDNFDTTAALFANLDGFVCVCTGPLHLAGALGLQSVCMLSWTGDWRWCGDESKTIWYPSVTLVRQQTQGDWHGVACRTAALITTWQPQTLFDPQQGPVA